MRLCQPALKPQFPYGECPVSFGYAVQWSLYSLCPCSIGECLCPPPPPARNGGTIIRTCSHCKQNNSELPPEQMQLQGFIALVFAQSKLSGASIQFRGTSGYTFGSYQQQTQYMSASRGINILLGKP